MNTDPNLENLEYFELELMGGAVHQKYRQLRPEVDELPWGTLDPTQYPPEVVLAARKSWTGAAFQEFRTGAACAATVRALIEARAPIDLIGLASRFPIDEMVHVEICSRIAGELGGAVNLAYDPKGMIGDFGIDDHPIVRAAHLVVAYFCVGEALSIPLLHGTWQVSEHPLIKAALRRIVLDEADHGTFGWSYLDWANHHLDDTDRSALGETADATIQTVLDRWEFLRQEKAGSGAFALGWMGGEEYLKLAEHALARNVIGPLLSRGIPVSNGLEHYERYVSTEQHK